MDYVVEFTDQRGVKRELPCIAPMEHDNDNMRWLSDLACEDQPVGLLYLPDTDAVIVTDLWLDYTWDPAKLTRPINPAKRTAEENAFFERIKNMPKEEAEKEILAKLDDIERRLDGSFGIFSWFRPRQDYTDEFEKTAEHTAHTAHTAHTKHAEHTKYRAVAEDEAASWEHIENMSQEEITAKLKEMSERRNSDKRL